MTLAGRIGDRVTRKEDTRFLTGKGQYTDDMVRPFQAYACFVRSQMAHARVKVDASDAEKLPGVLAVLTGEHMKADGVGSIPTGWQIHSRDGSPMKEPPHPPLADGVVRHVGDQIAVVVAETQAQAKSAAKAVAVEYEDLPVVANLEQAVAPNAPLVWELAPGNQCYDFELGDKAATDAAFSKATHVVAIDLINNRVVPNAIEPRSCIGEYDASSDHHTLYTTTQNPHLIRLLMGAFVLNLPEHKLRVVAPDVGGGFGSKIYHYAEEAVVTWASKRLGRPVKWTAERTESFQTDAHGRDHRSHAELALDADGNFLGLRVQTKANMGAYLSTFAPAVPTYLYATLLAGVYKTPAIYCEVQAFFTNTAPVDAYRGAGRPEATYLLERLVEKAARECGFDRVELRRKNMIKESDFPYQTPVALEYDIGNFEATLDLALEKIDYANFEKRREASKKAGKLRGLGLSTYIEACGLAPSALAGALGARAGLYESATIRVHPTGSVTVFTGTHSHGQGHETAFAQIVADKLGISFESVELVHGDTANTAFGMGTYGSRSLPVGGSAIAKATEKVIEKGKKIAAHLLEADAGDIEFSDGHFAVKGTDRKKAFAEVAFSAYVPHNYPLEELEPGLEESSFYDPKNFTFPGGCHIAEVEVDPDTGVVQLIDMAAADDVGRVINPLIVDGQIQGGLAQGIGQALYEACTYDETGQLLTASYMNYCMPRAADLPFFKTGNHVTPCTHNPLGSKGCGEAGAIGSPPAVINAVLDALAPLGVKDLDMPATPQRVWKAIQTAKRDG
ncbi:MAG: xanthine dehydrogenase family protein molybdopterin-binding subunit [Myxococcota bacterium]